MGFGGSTKASRDRYSEDTYKTGQENTSGQKRSVFDSPESKQILSYLTGQTAGGQQFGNEAGNAYRSLAGDQGNGANPYVDNIIQHSNKEGDIALQNGLAQLRSGGYRGGTGADLYNQGKLVADAANQRALGNANLRYGAFNDAQGRALTSRLSGAGGLAQLGQGQQGLAAQLLALLRGEDINSLTNRTEQGVSSGTKSSTSGSGGFNFGTFGG